MAVSIQFAWLKAALRTKVLVGAGWGLFFWDYLACLIDDRHTAAPNSYTRMRRLYSRTKGKTAKILSLPFQIVHPPYQYKLSPDVSIIAETIAEQGYCKLDATTVISEVAKVLHKRLSLCSVQEVLQGFEPGFLYENLEAAFKSADQEAARLEHVRSDVCLIPETWELIRRLKLREIASTYLRCDPILTSVDSWHVVPIRESCASDGLYSAAAQTYHYDMDWIRFLKVFINLTPAPMESGPFEYIAFSHEKKSEGYFRDGRFERLLDSSSEVSLASGDIGSCFFADTSGIHRDGRATTATRHVLQVEFAVASFGSKFQYNEIYKQCCEAVRPIKKDFPSSSRMFALF